MNTTEEREARSGRRIEAGSPFGGIRLGRLFGVEIRVDWSLLIIFMLVLVSLGWQMLPAWHPEWAAAQIWVVAFLAAVLFFASVLAHEMSHALVGRWQGIPIRRITLFLFGGMAHMEDEPPTPTSELLMAAVGPLTSALIGIAATVAGWASVGPGVAVLFREDPAAALSLLGMGETILLWLGPINIMLGVFNLVPGFPLDGGRVLRALVWAATKDLRKATRVAAGAGRLIAILLMSAGVAMAFGFYLPFFGTGLGSGLWLLLIGWFLHQAARTSYRQLLMREALAGVRVVDVMRRRFDAVHPELPLDRFMRDHVMQTDQEIFPVVVDRQLVGLARVRDAMRIPAEQWSATPVAAVMLRADQVATVAPDGQVKDALRRLQTQGLPQLPVVEGGELLGVLRDADIFKWVMLRSEEAGAPG